MATASGASLAWAPSAEAQQKTFHLDRLDVPGSPDDGFVIFRPYTRQNTIFFAQLGLGYSLQPLRTSQIIADEATINRSHVGVVQDQLTSYANVGFELFDRLIVGASLPITWVQSGQNPNYGRLGLFGNAPATTTVSQGGPATSDLRLDFRGVIVRSEDRRAALGARLSLYAPTGTQANFGSDGQTTTELAVNGEIVGSLLTWEGETGVAFRPNASLNSPTQGQGLGIGDEWKWKIGAFLPLQRNKFRIGATLFGQTGIENNHIIGNTIFTKNNTDLEWLVEGRMRFGPQNHWWTGIAGGTRILEGYGGPNLRLLALVGFYVPILDSDATSPEARNKWKNGADRDGDGIPDELDACPDEAEDHLGNDPNDGCPIPPDRDGDGIPDPYDKCPDVPEDKDGVEDWDGCPEDDADHDGVPDTMDACPREPGKPAADPKKNGCPQFIHMDDSGTIRVLQQVHFKTGSAEILPDSFPMLTEIAQLLDANPSITRMSIEGHTDNTGNEGANMRLSEARAKSVMTWITQHGVEADRLESHGYGQTQPVADNDTDAGRAQNRRVEFKILHEETGQRPPHHTEAPPQQEAPSDDGPRNEGEL